MKKEFHHDRVAKLKKDDPASWAWYKHIELMTSRSQLNETIHVLDVDQSKVDVVAETVNSHFISISSSIAPLDMSKLPPYVTSDTSDTSMT